MPRFSANLGFLFADRPHGERIAAAAVAGFPAVEMHWPYEVPAATLRTALDRAGVRMLGINTPVGDRARGDNGLAAVPGREAEFAAAFDLALSYAVALGGTAVHCMAGVVPPDRRDAAERTYVANLTAAADKAAAAGKTILIEPLNPRDAPGYFLADVDQAAAIVQATGRANVKIMFDCYHVQIVGGDVIRRFECVRPLVGHVQIAAVPSRAEPDEGELAYPAILAAFEAAGWDGFVGAEYKPRGRTEDGLGWMAAYPAAEAVAVATGDAR
ncbi:hydroxypyruvate isomerase family protein [Rhodoplanes serenus]|uniref:hydroxypyruvate isomerase family protein n=1 Tax=Rhodoplanes serenus TaxID=200615 RepID=UPI000DAB8679|nr:TIM barrel protein [Rhodoplanes serenus]RAI34840.1 isomerase [Rhodoplanes serenus]